MADNLLYIEDTFIFLFITCIIKKKTVANIVENLNHLKHSKPLFFLDIVKK